MLEPVLALLSPLMAPLLTFKAALARGDIETVGAFCSASVYAIVAVALLAALFGDWRLPPLRRRTFLRYLPPKTDKAARR